MSVVHAFSDEVFKRRHLTRFFSNFIREVDGNDHHAVIVTGDDVTWKDRSITATNWNIDVEGLVARQIGRRRRPVMKCRNVQLGNFGRITEPTVGHNAGHSAFHKTCHQDRTGRSRSRILAAVDNEHRSLWTLLNGLALRMLAVPEHLDRI